MYKNETGSQFWRLRSPDPGEPVVSSGLSLKAERQTSQLEDRQRTRILSHSAFCSFLPFSNWVRPTHTGEGNLLAQLAQMLIFLRQALTDPPRIMFDQISGHPVTQSNGHIK